ncbi:hypothetical protein TNCV_563472 [Trichonephila clavipes]|nr:hypothetical protein TNCV_563472 [Trichonephila clavipes]
MFRKEYFTLVVFKDTGIWISVPECHGNKWANAMTNRLEAISRLLATNIVVSNYDQKMNDDTLAGRKIKREGERERKGKREGERKRKGERNREKEEEREGERKRYREREKEKERRRKREGEREKEKERRRKRERERDKEKERRRKKERGWEKKRYGVRNREREKQSLTIRPGRERRPVPEDAITDASIVIVEILQGTIIGSHIADSGPCNMQRRLKDFLRSWDPKQKLSQEQDEVLAPDLVGPCLKMSLVTCRKRSKEISIECRTTIALNVVEFLPAEVNVANKD